MSLLDTASLILTPNGYKGGVTTGKLYSVKPTDASGDMDVVRATTATRVNSAGLIESVAINVPRLDYTGGSCPSILLEPARTNLVLYSEEFDNASWTKTNTTITANSSTSPDGTSTADILVENSTSNVVFGVNALSRPSGLTLTTTYSVSFFAKKITRDFCYYNDFNGFQIPSVRVYFNLSTGLVGTSTLGVLNPKMENYGNGWYRCSFQFVATIGTQIDYRIASATTDNVSTYTGVIGQQAIAIWGAQFETGSNATSYIPTTTATVTRNADVISKTGVSSLIGQTEGTLFLDAKYLASATSSGRWFKLFGVSNEIGLALNGVNSVRAIINGLSDTITTSPKTDLGIKIAFAYNATGVVLFINGTQYALPLGGAQIMTSLDSIIFDAAVNPQFQQGEVNSFILFKTRLTDPQLATLTAI
jgi:hypothetical protein